MLDDDELAESPADGREDASPACRSTDGRALGRRDVDPGMEAIPSRAEEVADWACNRLNEPDRRTRQRPAKRSKGRGARGPVRLQPGPDLELPQRSVGVRPEHPVEDRRRKTVPRERELKRRPRRWPRGARALRESPLTLSSGPGSVPLAALPSPKKGNQNEGSNPHSGGRR